MQVLFAIQISIILTCKKSHIELGLPWAKNRFSLLLQDGLTLKAEVAF